METQEPLPPVAPSPMSLTAKPTYKGLTVCAKIMVVVGVLAIIGGISGNLASPDQTGLLVAARSCVALLGLLTVGAGFALDALADIARNSYRR